MRKDSSSLSYDDVEMPDLDTTPTSSDSENSISPATIFSYYAQLDYYAKIIYTELEKNLDRMKSGTYNVDFGTTFDDLLHKDKHHVAFQLRQLMIQNEKLERHPFIFWISLYASKEEFEFKDEICAKEDMDIPEIMERSIRLMESYQAAIPLFEEDFCEIIMEEQKESYLPGE